ncbi:MAG: SAVED domain-containing protein [Paracoccaceae bacterium]|nr:SAVED domain-containing protein [Paracoccaceae bacterium]MDE2674607.1 SAVED domain-containing protein [Paracoccaceae bacterium]
MHYNPDNLFHYIIKTGADWLFRVKTVPSVLIKSGLLLIVVSFGGWKFIGIETAFLKINFSDAATPETILWAVFLLGGISFIAGVLLSIMSYVSENTRKKTIVIEKRGLKFSPDTRLKDSAGKIRSGKLEVIDCDIRQRMNNGVIDQPEEALSRITNLQTELEAKCNNVNSDDLKIIYGGLMAVPFTFLTGILIDDENDLIQVFDWDRHAKKWRELNGSDDQERFDITGLEDVSGKEEAILVVSASYKVDFETVKATLGTLPVVHMELPNGGTNCHWSKNKQTELCRSFTDTLVKLKSLGLKNLHLFVAAPNSLCFNLGRHYDNRNFPHAKIYQYEQSINPPYPCSLVLPTHGKKVEIIRSTKLP